MPKRPLMYVTGIAGGGKSAVCDELKRRGYDALDIDKDDIAAFYDNKTGTRLSNHVPTSERTAEWRALHTWKAPRERVQALAERPGEGPVFLCGVTANDADDLWDLFSKIFALVVDDKEVLRQRVLTRDEDGFGKNEHELADLMRWQQTAHEDYQKLGAIVIDTSSQSLNSVVDTIVALASA
ncbi:MAG TPA: AAA family ATPase [Candidatus Saccharimonadales bacterium]|nr:AAA family ATPase [Candidatus Saccharimonadales bacterium]